MEPRSSAPFKSDQTATASGRSQWQLRANGEVVAWAALLAAGIEWSRQRDLHKLVLDVFPHNVAAIALYRKFGFVQEGRRAKQYRRANGEFWDSLNLYDDPRFFTEYARMRGQTRA